MLRAIVVCEHCEKEIPSFEEDGGILYVNFLTKEISFLCPKCNRMNALIFDEIQKRIEKSARLPRIKGTRF